MKPSRQGAATILALRRAERKADALAERAKTAPYRRKAELLLLAKLARTAALSLTPRRGVEA